MPKLNVGHAYLLAWRYARYVPEPILRGLVTIGADIAWLKHGKGVKRLESNYAKVRPDLSAAEIRQLAKKGIRAYARYFREAFTLPGATPEQLNARVRAQGLADLKPLLTQGQGVVIPLGHFGNWDMAGAWSASNLAPVLTVAEKLNPPKLYAEFLNFRQSLGMTVLGLGDEGVFDALTAGAENGPRLIALLGDRDLSRRGVEVTLAGHRARVAAGPAALSLATGAPLVPALIRHERLHGKRRKAAGTPWGIVIDFTKPIWPVLAPADGQIAGQARNDGGDSVETLTQKWVNVISDFITEYPADWHMLQKVFVADLDPDKYAATLGSGGFDRLNHREA